jgi:hypothetical protein
MKIELPIPEYKKEEGIESYWENGFEIGVSNLNNEIVISSNKQGLISLAIQLLTLAQDTVPIGSHFHYDEHNSLESGSSNLVIEKRA